MKLTLLDADDVRAGVLARLDLLVMPGGSSALIKKDLGPAGVDGVKDFIRNGGGYIGTCAGCSLLLDGKEDAARVISVIPYGRAGSKGLYMMPVAVNARGAAAMGIPAGEYKVRYSAGPVLVASKRTIEGASFDVWGRYAGDFEKRC
jgi:putative intracellular protease/amidase